MGNYSFALIYVKSDSLLQCSKDRRAKAGVRTGAALGHGRRRSGRRLADRCRDFGQQPFTEGADFWHVAARFGVDQPIGMAIVADEVKGLDQAAVRQFGAKTGPASGSRRHGRPWQHSLHRLARPCWRRAARRGRRSGHRLPRTTAPTTVAGVEQRQAQQVGGFLHAADAFGEFRAQHRREIRLEEQIAACPGQLPSPERMPMSTSSRAKSTMRFAVSSRTAMRGMRDAGTSRDAAPASSRRRSAGC